MLEVIFILIKSPLFLRKYHTSLMFRNTFNTYFIDKYKQEHIDVMFIDAMKFKNYRTIKYLLNYYLEKHKFNIVEQINEQIKHGNTEVVLFLLDNVEYYKYVIDETSMIIATTRGYLECITVFHRFGITFGNAFQIVARYGHLECLKYLHNEGEWDEDALQHAAECGHFDCVKYLYEQGATFNYVTSRHIIKHGNLTVLQWCWYNKCPMPINSIALCAKYGHVDCLEFFHKLGFDWDSNAPAFAAYSGNIACLKYLATYCCPWDERTIAVAAKNGHYECMRFAFHNNCPINNMRKYLENSQIHPSCREYIHKFIMRENGEKIDL